MSRKCPGRMVAMRICMCGKKQIGEVRPTPVSIDMTRLAPLEADHCGRTASLSFDDMDYGSRM